jgi:hypothetical protein
MTDVTVPATVDQMATLRSLKKYMMIALEVSSFPYVSKNCFRESLYGFTGCDVSEQGLAAGALIEIHKIRLNRMNILIRLNLRKFAKVS